MTINTESGLRPSRIEFTPENGNQGETPNDPEWELPSNRVTNFEPELGPEEVEKPGLGDAAADVAQGLEENEVTLEYDLQRWFLDNNGDPQDLAGYGLIRRAGLLPDSLTLVERIESGDTEYGMYLQPESTVEYEYNETDPSEITRKASRIYTVAKGSDVSEVTLTGETGEVYWHVEATLSAEEVRSYQIDQPTQATDLVVYAEPPEGETENTVDTGLTVVIEDEGANTSEEVQLDGTDASNNVVTGVEFSDIDAIEVQNDDGETADHIGNIVVAVNSGSETDPAEGEVLSVLYGRDYYGNTHGDAGVPMLGAGSHADEIQSDYYYAANTLVERPEGKPFEAAGSVSELELTVENEIETTAQQQTRSPLQHQGAYVPELAVTADGETTTHKNLVERMAGKEHDTVLKFGQEQNETITLPRAVITESGRVREAGSAVSESEFTIRAQDTADISNAAN